MQRLKTRPQFQAALAAGTAARTAHFALHRLRLAPMDMPPTGPDSSPQAGQAQALFGVGAPAVWLGAMVPKRWARRAVTRNAIKRQIFAVAALNATRLPPAAHVVRLRSAFDRKQFVSARSEALCQAVRAELLQLFERSSRKALPEAALAGSAAP